MTSVCERISNDEERIFSWQEVRRHTKMDDKWIVIDECVYDITSFQNRHPGGAKLISHFAGQDATDAWLAMHRNLDHVRRFLRPLFLGRVVADEAEKQKLAIREDFRRLRSRARELGLFESRPLFYILNLAHIILLECIAYQILRNYTSSWCCYLVSAVLLATSQAQAGWTQHDYGHHSVLPTTFLNHLLHRLVIGTLKGASSNWWNFRHFQHHVKPNCHMKDPDITIPYVFLFGDTIPEKWAQAGRGFLPYNVQHLYFWLMGPVILLPVVFHIEVTYFLIRRRDWKDLCWILTFFLRWFYFFGGIVGGLRAFKLYMLVRLLESFWFTMVTQMNHIPMKVDFDRDHDWFTSQCIATCNVEDSAFNNWFTGHLNYQIEHHLFPTMPRHSFAEIAPLIKQLCEKHQVPYIVKPLSTAFIDIVRSLKASGKIWITAKNSTDDKTVTVHSKNL